MRRCSNPTHAIARWSCGCRPHTPTTDLLCTQISLAPVIFGVAAHASMVHSESCVFTRIDGTLTGAPRIAVLKFLSGSSSVVHLHTNTKVPPTLTGTIVSPPSLPATVCTSHVALATFFTVSVVPVDSMDSQHTELEDHGVSHSRDTAATAVRLSQLSSSMAVDEIGDTTSTGIPRSQLDTPTQSLEDTAREVSKRNNLYHVFSQHGWIRLSFQIVLTTQLRRFRPSTRL